MELRDISYELVPTSHFIKKMPKFNKIAFYYEFAIICPVDVDNLGHRKPTSTSTTFAQLLHNFCTTFAQLLNNL